MYLDRCINVSRNPQNPYVSMYLNRSDFFVMKNRSVVDSSIAATTLKMGLDLLPGGPKSNRLIENKGGGQRTVTGYVTSLA